MPKTANQKLKLMYMAKLLYESTDESHGVSTQDIIDELAKWDISADRKTIYLDLEELRRFGMDILTEKSGRSISYHLVSRNFELPELKLLVDSVQASKFITEKKSIELIKKLEGLVSTYEAKQLSRQVVLTGRVKTMNESIYYSVDTLHAAINQNVRIRFKYFQWNVDKQPELRHGGAWYFISPWALVWDDEYYYLLGYDSQEGIIKHYRVDKMLNIELTDDPREGQEVFDKLDIPKYSKSLFGMFGGKETTVSLLCENSLAGAVIDRFGKDIILSRTDENHFVTRVNVSASRQFLGWVFALGDGVKITAPESMVEQMRLEAERLAEQYAK